METRIIYTKIWQDSWFRSLKHTEGLFWLYLLANEHVNSIHIFELPNEIVARHMRVTEAQAQKLKERMVEEKKIKIFKDYVFLANAYKYETYRGIKNNQNKLRTLRLFGQDAIAFFITEIGEILNDIEEENKKHGVVDEKFLNLFDEIKKRYFKAKSVVDEYPNDTPIDKGIDRVHKSINHKSINNKEIIKEKIEKKPEESFEYLAAIPEADVVYFTEDFEVSRAQLIAKGKAMYDWVVSKGKQIEYKDFKAVLRNAVRKDFGEKDEEKRKQDKANQEAIARMKAKDPITPAPEISPEQAEENRKRVEEQKAKIREKFNIKK